MSELTALEIIKQDTQYLKSSLKTLKEDCSKFFSEFERSLNEIKTLVNTQTNEPQPTAEKRKHCSDGDDNFKSIGMFRSCFLTKNGTPRQPGICPYARGTLTITCFNNPEHSLDSLSQFSHVWLLFLFHDNGSYAAKAKISPPRLNGRKVGVFASRSPHRPNNIGMSLVKLDGISGGTMFLSGVDLIDGTPVLDVKPYISVYDTPSVPSTSAPWINNIPTIDKTVIFSHQADCVLAMLKYAPDGNKILSNRSVKNRNCLRFFRNADELKQSIIDIISADPRSVFRKKQGDTIFSFPVDSVDVKVEVKGEEVHVLDISQTDYVRGLLKNVGS